MIPDALPPDALPVMVPVLIAALLATGSPGPATMAIAREAMAGGRGAGVALALGVTAGSWVWSGLAAGGMSAFLLAHGGLLDGLRIAAAVYLAWLAFKCARAAFLPDVTTVGHSRSRSSGSFLRGLLIHLTNPKPILFFGALFSVGLPGDTDAMTLGLVLCALWAQSLIVFVAFAVLFSNARLAAGYVRMRRGFEGLFALVFGLAATGFLLSVARPLLMAT